MMKRYPQYKDSGVEWLGEVPAHWGAKRVKHVVRSFEQGWSPQCEGFPVENDHEWGVLKVGCVNGGVFRKDENKMLPADMEPIPALGIRCGDLLISRANTRELVGSAAVARRDYANLLLCDKLYRLRVNQELYVSEYLGYYLGTDVARGQIELSATGASSSMLNIGQSTILEMRVPMPDVQSQQQIVDFLDRETAKIDTLIAEQQKLIVLLAEKRQATISHAVTRGLDPHVPMKDSGVAWLGEVPAHWDVSPLKYLASFRSGGTPSKDNLSYWDGDVPWASAKDLKSDRLADTIDHITAEAIAQRAADLVPCGSVLVVVRGMILARMFPVSFVDTPMAINQDLKAVIADENVQSEFLAWLLRGTADESLRRLDEAGHGTKALRMDAWASMKLPVPPFTEQVQISIFIEQETAKIDRLQTESERAIALLQERRSALITAAVTGQIDVRAD